MGVSLVGPLRAHANGVNNAIVPKQNRRMMREPLVRKVFAIVSIVPIGLYLVLHLWTQASALVGRDKYIEVIGRVASIPWWTALKVLLLAIPIVLHVVIGYRWAFDPSYQADIYPNRSNGALILQRACAAATVLFVLGHVIVLRVAHPGIGAEPGLVFDALNACLSSTQLSVPIAALAYMVGLAAVAFHVGQGLFACARPFGVFASGRAARVWAIACAALGVFLFCFATVTVVFHATGSRLIPGLGDSNSQRCLGSSPLGR